MKNTEKLGIETFENNFNCKIPSELKRQYDCSITDKELNGLLLSNRSNRSKKGYMCCSSCHLSLTHNKSVKGPPRYSIANGFLIGHIPKNVMEEIDITELVSAMIVPIRPLSYALSFSGGALKTLKGHHTFLKTMWVTLEVY